MRKAKIETRIIADGFRIGEHIHKSGMADLWAVTREAEDLPLLMEIPVLRESEDPAANAGFEMEQMILPRRMGPDVPRLVANGDFKARPYIVMERIAGTTLLPRHRQD